MSVTCFDVYRVWDRQLGKYVDNILVGPYGSLVAILVDSSSHMAVATIDKQDMPRYVVERCTGLRDSNGTPIYDGDYLVIAEPSKCGDKRISHINVVLKDAKPFSISATRLKYAEVVGNKMQGVRNDTSKKHRT